MKCRVLPFNNLKFPVLPYRCEKLTFPLCRVCVEKRLNKKCNHSVNQRALLGTWCTPELMLAVARGCQILEIFKVYHFSRKQGRLFANYINEFLKVKTEASGWPNSVRTDEEKDAYIDAYVDREDVKLEKQIIAV